MGESGAIPPEVNELLQELDAKAPQIVESCKNENQKMLDKQQKLLPEREKKVSAAVQEKIEEEELKKLLLKYNIKEINIEKEFIINEVDKMYKLYEIGKQLAEKLKKVTLDLLNKKLEKAPQVARGALNRQIEQVNSSGPKDFLDTEFGKPLKRALEKYGMSQVLLQTVMDGYKKERKVRREVERNKYKISQNEFPPEDELNISAGDLYNLIFAEYKDGIKSVLGEKLNLNREEE